MKKIISLLLALVMCLSLCACGSEKTEPTIETLDYIEAEDYDGWGENAVRGDDLDALIGKWHCEETKQVITITAGTIYLFSQDFNGVNLATVAPANLMDEKLLIDGIGLFTLEESNGVMSITCEETMQVSKGLTFVKEEDLYKFEDLCINWIDPDNGSTLDYDPFNGFTLTYKKDGVKQGEMIAPVFDETMYSLVGSTLYLQGIAEFEIIEDNGTLKLNGVYGEFIPA